MRSDLGDFVCAASDSPVKLFDASSQRFSPLKCAGTANHTQRDPNLPVTKSILPPAHTPQSPSPSQERGRNKQTKRRSDLQRNRQKRGEKSPPIRVGQRMLYAVLAETAMSNPHLPAEILDHVVDLLHNNPESLERCCLVSKSWVPRARKHLFANVWLSSPTSLQSWKAKFPHPPTSPARYTKILSVHCSEVVTVADAEAGGWIRDFSRVVQLKVGSRGSLAATSAISFVPFHGLSPVIKSLSIILLLLPSSPIFDLILSFPLLEDLNVLIHKTPANNDDDLKEDEMPITVQPSSPPMFTGSLVLSMKGGMKSFALRLLSLSGGIHFRKLALTWNHKEDPLVAMALVQECSRTLESFRIISGLPSKFHSASASTPVTYFYSKKDWSQLRSTSRKRQSSRT